MAKVTIGGRTYEVEVRGTSVVVDGEEFPIEKRAERDQTLVRAGSEQYLVRAPEAAGETFEVEVDYRPFTVAIEGTIARGAGPRERKQRVAAAPGAPGGVTSPMSGTIVRVDVNQGDHVHAGDLLLIMEAMKMENEIKAPADGVVKEVNVSPGSKVSEGTVLVVLE